MLVPLSVHHVLQSVCVCVCNSASILHKLLNQRFLGIADLVRTWPSVCATGLSSTCNHSDLGKTFEVSRNQEQYVNEIF